MVAPNLFTVLVLPFKGQQPRPDLKPNYNTVQVMYFTLIQGITAEKGFRVKDPQARYLVLLKTGLEIYCGIPAQVRILPITDIFWEAGLAQ